MAVPTAEEKELLEEEQDFPPEDSSIIPPKWINGNVILMSATLLAILIIGGYILFSFSFPKILPQDNGVLLAALVTILLLVALLIPFVFLYLLVSRMVVNFFERFYNPPEGTKTKDIIAARLRGTGPFVPIRSTNLTSNHSWLNWLGGPAGLVIHDGFAVYLEKGHRFSRVIGPGITHIETDESVKEIVDLRPIVRPGHVKAWTKDGINIEIDVSMECQIGHETARPDDPTNLVYPFNPEDVKKAVEKNAVRLNPFTKTLETYDWVAGVWGKVSGFLATYISSHTVDELFLAEWGTSQMLSQNASRKLFQDLNLGLAEYGAHISNLQITNFKLPKEVDEQRVETWQAERQSMEAITIGQTNAYEIREREKARAEAEQEIIANIAKDIESIDLDRLQETILLSLSGILDQSLADPSTRTLITNDTLDALEKLKKLL